ncbi:MULTISPECIES: hypothetical protein [unclassified Breznakia]|uniref:hypothetical protein n=1 Tax=unclassified Breznakia TaxID=2623764 RepID=UPI002474A20E|nr:MULTISPECIES: hypothetical protein [unclassified Breznakia]MDH6366065.1 hypothetical protein [Breznakia sp. PH1-1]MDH6403003.1 hypothetical protein [Breznakia sp. PF1-11]MDH6410712.1 hypothetical protein [Breznakia sp. PFB1-11]MDH6413231.1 hypothetical protein [Breznakia sp. PFB1-14]MDH6415599.1 hypothetical protein [Breznakia sp. PFB1-4]
MNIKQQVQRFWRIFLEERSNLERALDHNDEAEITEITKILNTYFEEFSNSQLDIAKEEDSYEITFLSGQDKNVQLIGVLLKQLAPEAILDTWIVNSYLPPLSTKALHTILRVQDKEYTANDFMVYYEIDENAKALHCEVYCDAFEVMDESKANEVAVYMLQLFIGECALEAYIASYEIVRERHGGSQVVLSQFYELLMEIIDEKEWPMYQDPTQIYRVYKLDEKKIKDEVRQDMKIIFTTHPVLIAESLQDQYVTSHEFFDFGGEFGYVYYENQNGNESDALFRQALEKKFNELLFEKGIAKSIGGAMGATYAYVDLAIYDKEAFIKALKNINEHLSVKLEYRAFNDETTEIA